MSDERAAFAGQITDLPVVELLRTISTGKKTGVARFETNLGNATVWFREGTLVDADMGRFHMGDAVRRLIGTDAGSFEVEFKPVTRRQLIQETTSALLADDAVPTSAAAPKPAASPRPKLTLPASAENARRGPGTRRSRVGASWKPTGGGTGQDGAGAASPDMLRRLEALRRAADEQPPRADVLDRTAALGSGAAKPGPARTTGRSTGETPQAGLEALNRLAQKASAARAQAPAPDPEPTRPADDQATKVDGAIALGPHPTPVTPAQPVELGPDLDLGTGPAKPSRPAPPRPTETPDKTIADPVPRSSVVATPGRKAEGPRPTAALGSRKSKATVAGIPAQTDSPPPQRPAKTSDKKDANGWSFVDPTLEAEQPEPDTDRTLMRMGPLPLQAPAKAKRPGGNRKSPPRAQPENRQPEPGRPTRVDPADDLSDPLPIGTSWSAPAHISTPRSKPIESDKNPSAGGEIGKGGRPTSGQTVVAFAPGSPAASMPDPGATMTDGFRPITRAEGPDGSVPRVGSAAPEPVANKIGLQPPSTPPKEAPKPVGGGAAQVGRYEVLLRIARGGMGTVYLCQVTGAGGFRRLFALKVIRDHLSRNEEYVRMLLQEARIASRLHHPNVVGIVDIGNLANQHYLVMDYVEGCTLSELLKVHRKTRPPHLIIPIVLDALTGLHAAHTLTDDDGSPLTLVHCDFSPQNMLVGTNGICRITDFGIARASNALPERSSITRGKPAYLAPEQITGRPFDHRADIFAAGVVLWNALTGEQLFKGDTPEEVLDKVLNMAIPAPSTVGLRPPKKLDKVVLRALERDPAKRFQSAEEMLIELRKVAIGSDLLAPSSEVAQWVLDTFGTQLELRRQAAGLAPAGHASAKQPAGPREPTAIALRDDDAPAAADDSATHALVSQPHAAADASQTMMLQSGKAPAAGKGNKGERASDAVLGSRARTVVMGLVISAAAAVLAIAVVRPELLTGGMLDEEGEYIDLGTPDDEPNFEAEAAKAKAKAGTDPTKPKAGTDAPKPGTPAAKANDPASPSEPPADPPRDPSPTTDDGTPSRPAGDVPPPPKPGADKPRRPRPEPKAGTDKPKPAKDTSKPATDKPEPKPKAGTDKPEPKPKAGTDKPEPAAPDLPSAPNLDELLGGG